MMEMSKDRLKLRDEIRVYDKECSTQDADIEPLRSRIVRYLTTYEPDAFIQRQVHNYNDIKSRRVGV